MKQNNHPKSMLIFNDLFKEHKKKGFSMRKFALLISENYSDVQRWTGGTKKLTVRCVITLCKLFDYHPHDLNPDVFPEDLHFVFYTKKR